MGGNGSQMVDLLKNLAFIFPGQGSQCIGMGKSLYEYSPLARECFEQANDCLGFDIKKICFEGTIEELNSTENTQPAILTTSIAALSVLNKELPLEPSYVAGHSLGEYSALVCAGVLEFQDAVKLVRLRGRFMQDAAANGIGKMSAIIGLTPDEVEDVCRVSSSENEKVVPANINSPEQVVISGSKNAVERAEQEAKKMGAKRVIPLPVSVPSHSPLMKDAAEKLDQELAKVTFKEFNTTLITNVEAKPIRNKERIRELLKLQLTSPVRWVDIIRRLRKEGVTKTIEIGPGRVLTGLVKRIDKEIMTFNLSEAGDLKEVKDSLSILSP